MFSAGLYVWVERNQSGAHREEIAQCPCVASVWSIRPLTSQVQPRDLGHHLDGLWLARSHAERIRAAVLPSAVAFADARRWADQRFQIDPLVGHGGDGFGLVAREVQFLDALGGVAEAAPDHDIVVKILGPVTHAAHIERHLRLEARQRPFHVVVDLDMDGGLDDEILQALAVAGAAEAFLQPRDNFSMAPGTKPIGSQPSAISAVSLTIASPPVAR